MTIAKWCVLLACMLPPFTILLAKLSLIRLSRKQGGFDNHHPREWEAKLTGWQSRAHAAQLNGFEALPLFIAGVVFAHIGHADLAQINMLAIAFVLIRVAYVVAYVMDWATLRSIIWTAGVGVSIALLAMGV